jgi:hypothetical protein
LKKTLKTRRKHKKTRKNQSNKRKNKYSKKEAFARFKHSNPALSSSSLALGLA